MSQTKAQLIANNAVTDVAIASNAEVAVSKLADGAARQVLQTDAAGTGVEWTGNLDLPGTLTVTGTTTLKSDVTLNAQSDLRFADSDSSNWVAFQAPATIASNVTWTLPSTDGSPSQVLSTNGSGTLSWATAGGGGGGGDVFLANNNAFTGANTFYNTTGQTFGTGTSTQDGLILKGRAGGISSYRVSIVPGTLSANRTYTLPDADGTAVLTGGNNAFSGANTFYNSTGQTFGTGSTTEDGIILQGRAGGTNTYRVTVVPGTLTANRTLTLPNTTGTVITSNDSGTVTGSMIASNVALAGTPTTTTQTTGNNTTAIATTAFVNAQITASAVTLSANNAFTGANTFYNTTGQTFGTATPAQDGIILAGRVGGVSSYRVTLQPTALTANRTLTLPNISGTVITNSDTGTVTDGMLAGSISYSKLATLTAGSIVLGNASNVATSTAVSGDVTINSSGVTSIASGVIVNADISASAAISYSKLASLTAGSIIVGNASNVATATAVSGDVTINSSGVTAISSNVIVDSDINTAAAIAGTKISPNFGSQDIITTGTVQGVLKAGTAISTVSVSTATFSSIPSWVKRINIIFSGVSCTGADAIGIRVGTSGGIVSTGYSGSLLRLFDASGINVNAFSTEFTLVFSGGNAATTVYSGNFTLSNLTGNTWVIGGTFAADTTSTNARMGFLNGYITLASALTQVQLIDLTAGFDAGTINILYEG